MRSVRLSLSFALVLLGCAPHQAGGGGAGTPCVRAAQCEPGLVCISGACSNDIAAIEGGVVPVRDAMVMMMDAQVIMYDSGPPPPMMDAFVPPRPDAFVPPEPDAFVPPEPDAFVPPVDEDAGM
jgi:hypothetical protein